MTVSEAATQAAQILIEAGFEPGEARRDVAVLARHLLGWTLTDWAARNRETAPVNFSERLHRLTNRRATHEPVAYITGEREFYGRTFQVTRDVLIPRPETEQLIDAILPGARNHEAAESETFIDIGAGTGCIAITLKLECPWARVIATDVSTAALAVARHNAQRLGADVEFVEASLLPPGVQADLIVSNPPYVPERDRASLSPDVHDFEPARALFAGPDGLGVIRELVPVASAALKPGGRFLMEIGAGQAEAVSAIVTTAGLALESIRADLQGIPRVVIARKPGAAS